MSGFKIGFVAPVYFSSYFQGSDRAQKSPDSDFSDSEEQCTVNSRQQECCSSFLSYHLIFCLFMMKN